MPITKYSNNKGLQMYFAVILTVDGLVCILLSSLLACVIIIKDFSVKVIFVNKFFQVHL